MATVEREDLMADGRPKTLSVKLHEDVVESARIVAALENVTLTDLLSDILRPLLARREQEAIARRTKGRGGKKPEA